MTAGESLQLVTHCHIPRCTCDECLPGIPAQSTAVHFTGRRSWANKRERRKAENARAYMRRKLAACGWGRDIDQAALDAFSP